MISDSPHRYLDEGRKLGRSDTTLRAALARAAPVEANGLTAVLSLGHLAHQTGAKYGYLRSIVSRKNDAYRGFEIRRRGGKAPRYISSPEPVLKSVQRWMLDNVVGRVQTIDISFAYETGSSIRQCAARHVEARWLVKLDLHNFFHSIDERQVFRVLNALGYDALPAFEMSRLATRLHRPPESLQLLRLDDIDSWSDSADSSESNFHYPVIDYPLVDVGWLPQGAPTSGALANLVSWPLDLKLSELAAATDTVVTRYADDITFSGLNAFSRSSALSLANRAGRLIALAGFKVHHEKTRIVPPGARKIVLGLLVDRDYPRLPKDFRRRLLGHVRGVEVFGIAAHRQQSGFTSTIGLLNHVRGLIDFAHDIDADWASGIRARWDEATAHHGWEISEYVD